MKALQRADLFGWSRFDESRNLDFNGVLWVRPEGNVAFDPMPLGEHDTRHLEALGSVAHIVITNSDHTRDAAALKARTGAVVYGPRAEREALSGLCDEWLGDGDEPLPGLRVLELSGSKTPGELALVLDGTVLITGDLIRAHAGGRLDLLPVPKLSDVSAAHASLRRLADLDGMEAVLVGDGWPVFRDGQRLLKELAGSVGA
jgi:hypothetical protein